MEKQHKVLTSINKALNHGQNNSALQELRRNPNDECYTDMQDILNELAHWGSKGKFIGKNIICPCDFDITDDNTIYGITITYNDNGIEVVGNNVYKNVKKVELKKVKNTDKLIDTSVNPAFNFFEQPIPTYEIINLKEDEIEDFLRNKLTCNFLRTLTQHAREWKIKSITASGYNPENGLGTRFQEINYKSYDVCVTNPPFSLYSEFMKCMVGNIDFIILAPYLNRVNPCIGLYLMTNKAYLGYGRELQLDFENPTPENKYHTKHVACDWIVSWPDAQEDINSLHYSTNINYETYKDDYTEMTGMTMKDGTHPILVGRRSYPSDYNGWMFGSVGILNKLDQSQYEWFCTSVKKYYNKTEPSANPFNHTATDIMVKNPITGKGIHEIIFRKKQNKEK